MLVASAKAIAEEYPDIDVHAIVGDYERHLDALDSGGRRLFAFLGSTLGNFEQDGRRRFLDALAASLKPADALLLGLDLVKEPARLESAYNDSAGLSERFQRNGARPSRPRAPVPTSRAHASSTAPSGTRNASGSTSASTRRACRSFQVPALGIDVELAQGERLRTQVSTKFRRERFESELADAGLALRRWWTDENGDFALCLTATSG